MVIFVRLVGWSSLQHPPKARLRRVLFAPMIASSFQGQVWTSMSKMRLQFRNGFKKHEPQVFEIITFPKFGIGQRAFLIQTQEGNILWDCISFLDDATVEIIKSLGGLRAIAISHPHYYSTNSRWSEAFGGVPVYIHEWDKKWVVYQHENVKFWEGKTFQLWEGLTLLHLGGHFAGAQILHWSHGAQGRGVLFTGDILQVGMDNKTVSIMRSYPNYIPLSSSHAKRIGQVIEPWDFERLYGAFQDREIEENAKSCVVFSLQRYIDWLSLDDAAA
ncbi:uncharacterized protein LOC9640785 isoform X2 [Selaginella moellendorffii]|uniref:uncharacterized protein LOC9640785 isoform X2 n=1 Tax=Selaginella moellendorffii TaxID=88036 RepID=UPI000D1C88A0|nr:uncharacterized protein LOC9640785 isoform X2 [Selaginella moellendorffii]|eukprot:XP_024515545.1 uncharacterized protein LOC9640785 isoform X2 [Selaginella moellendorffii]